MTSDKIEIPPSTLANGRDEIEALCNKKDDLLSRISSFLPMIRAANRELDTTNDEEQPKRQKLVDSNLKAVNDSDHDEDSHEDENDTGSDLDNDRVDDKYDDDDEDFCSREGDTNNQPSIVLNLALGTLDDNPVIELLADNSDNDNNDQPVQLESDHIPSVLISNSKKTPKGPLITEMN
jgi:hypothetical protein